MSVKVKIIAFNDGNRLMEAVNDFCKDKIVIDIKFQSLIVDYGVTSSVNDRVLIIYSEED